MSKPDNTDFGQPKAGDRTNTKRATTRQNKQRGPIPGSGQSRQQQQRPPTNQNQNQSQNRLLFEDIEFADEEQKNEGDNTMDSTTTTTNANTNTLTATLPVGAILAKIREKSERERVERQAQKQQERRGQPGRGKSGTTRKGQPGQVPNQGQEISLIIGSKEESFLPPGERIRLRRLHQKLFQSELAARANIKQGSLSSIESGKRESTPEILLKLAYILGIDPPTDIYKYYEHAIVEADNQLEQSQAAPAGTAAPEFLFLPPELTDDDKKRFNEMVLNLWKVRLKEKGLMSDISEGDVLTSLRGNLREQHLKADAQEAEQKNQNQNHSKKRKNVTSA